MNDIKLALLGRDGAALLVMFLTKRFIGEFASSSNFLYHKRLSVDGRQLKSLIRVLRGVGSRCMLEEPLEWADTFIVVYDVIDRTSFLDAKSILWRIGEAHIADCKGAIPVCLVANKQDLCHARQVCQEEGRLLALENKRLGGVSSRGPPGSSLFTELIWHAMERLKCWADWRRYSGSESTDRLINIVFCKRRKSV